MNDMTAQFLATKIDEFMRIMREIAEDNARIATALEAMASAKYEDEFDDEHAEPATATGLNLSKLNLDDNANG